VLKVHKVGRAHKDQLVPKVLWGLKVLKVDKVLKEHKVHKAL
jgi:hypothetical protein